VSCHTEPDEVCHSQLIMKNIYELKSAKVTKIIVENPTITTLFLKLTDQNKFHFLAGQFMQIGLPGFGECPISISSNPKFSKKYFSLTIRKVGELTEKLNQLKVGDTVLCRGPYGNGFPEVKSNLILIGGGCGFIPLRSVYEENKDRKDIKIQLFIGCRDTDSLVFKDELLKMKTQHDLNIILEKMVYPEYSKQKGRITDLLKNKELLPNAKIYICGPDIMFKFVVRALLERGISPENIFLSLEKRMHCCVGVCQHCACGTKYVCKDGPVFSYEYLKDFLRY